VCGAHHYGCRDLPVPCTDMTSLPCVFIIALGRTGSSHLLRVLNSIPGYRISGETDNAWIQLAQYATSRGIGSQQGLSRLRRNNSALCHLRQLMLLVHNPVPHARVFGFKEIYSDYVRAGPSGWAQILEHGVGSLRVLFPRAKFIFHYRRNVSRVAASDFWRMEQQSRITDFEKLISLYREYASSNRDHAIATTLDGLTQRKNPRHLTHLMKFLNEPLTDTVRRTMFTRMPLRDWNEEQHVRRITRKLANGTTVVETKAYAYNKEAQTSFEGAQT